MAVLEKTSKMASEETNFSHYTTFASFLLIIVKCIIVSLSVGGVEGEQLFIMKLTLELLFWAQKPDPPPHAKIKIEDGHPN